MLGFISKGFLPAGPWVNMLLNVEYYLERDLSLVAINQHIKTINLIYNVFLTLKSSFMESKYLFL